MFCMVVAIIEAIAMMVIVIVIIVIIIVVIVLGWTKGSMYQTTCLHFTVFNNAQ